ncbi:MAG: hypothetical protein VX899_14055 [Myxococcota bacterium]|nr:hypothetical protein [Myxococcota bacterium]
MADKPHIWEEEGSAEISYLKEMITSQASIGSVLGALSVGALLSIPLGLGVGAIPILLALSGNAIAALFVPSSPVFRAKVNRRKRNQRREAAREHLQTQINQRVKPDDPNWATYHRMQERLDSLTAMATNRDTALTETMVQRLNDSTVDFLGLWLAWLTMRERWESVDERTLKRRIRQIEMELEKGETSGVDTHHLRKAKADLQGVLDRRQSLWSRATSVEAAMLAMADTFEEVYQRVMANPNAKEVGAELNAAVERMRVEEQLDLAVDRELSDMLDPKKRAAARARQSLR